MSDTATTTTEPGRTPAVLSMDEILADCLSGIIAQARTFATAGFQNMELLNRSIAADIKREGAVSDDARGVRVFRLFFSFVQATEPGSFRAMFEKGALRDLLAPCLLDAGGRVFSLRHILDFLAAHDGESSQAALGALPVDCEALLDAATDAMRAAIMGELRGEMEKAAGHFEKMHRYKAFVGEILQKGAACVLPFCLDPAQVLNDFQANFSAFLGVCGAVTARRGAMADLVEDAVTAALAPAFETVSRAAAAYAGSHPASPAALSAHFRTLEDEVMTSRLAACAPGSETILTLLCLHCDAILEGRAPISSHWRERVTATRAALLG